MLGGPDPFASATPRNNFTVAVAVAGLVALAVAMGVGRFAFTPILPMMQEDVGLSLAQGGWLASANYLGYLVGALTAIGLTAHPATVIRWGLVTVAVATFAMGLANDFVFWFVLRFVAGVASAWALIFVSAWCLGKLAPLGRPLLNGTVFAGVGVGIIGAGLACIALMHLQATSAYTWVVFGVTSLVLSLVIWPAFDSVLEVRTKSPAHSRLDWDRDTLRLVACYGIAGLGYIIPATFLPVMAKQVIHDPAIFGWSWPVFGAAAAASTWMVSGLQKVIGNRRLWVASHLVMALGVALPVLWPGMHAIVLAALLVGGTFMVITMTGMQEAREVRGQHATGLMAAMTSAFAVGQIAGPAGVSYLIDAGGNFSWALLTTSFLLAAGGGMLLLRPRGVPSP